MNGTVTEVLLGTLRHLLTWGGGFITSAGLASEDEIQAGVAALVTLVGLLWSVARKIRNQPRLT